MSSSIYSQDMESFEMAEEFRNNLVNMTAFRLVEFDREDVKQTLRDIEEFRRVHKVLSSSSSSSSASSGGRRRMPDHDRDGDSEDDDDDVFLETFENPSRVLEVNRLNNNLI
jgi:hypothetical protein